MREAALLSDAKRTARSFGISVILEGASSEEKVGSLISSSESLADSCLSAEVESTDREAADRPSVRDVDKESCASSLKSRVFFRDELLVVEDDIEDAECDSSGTGCELRYLRIATFCIPLIT